MSGSTETCPSQREASLILQTVLDMLEELATLCYTAGESMQIGLPSSDDGRSPAENVRRCEITMTLKREKVWTLRRALVRESERLEKYMVDQDSCAADTENIADEYQRTEDKMSRMAAQVVTYASDLCRDTLENTDNGLELIQQYVNALRGESSMTNDSSGNNREYKSCGTWLTLLALSAQDRLVRFSMQRNEIMANITGKRRPNI